MKISKRELRQVIECLPGELNKRNLVKFGAIGVEKNFRWSLPTKFTVIITRL